MSLLIKNLCQSYNSTPVLKEIDLSFCNGFYALVGPNGSGKTTLLKTLCTLLPPEKGNIFYNNIDIFKNPAHYKRHLGYLPQHPGLYMDYTIEEYLNHMGSLKALRPIVSKIHIDKWLSFFNLESMRYSKIKTLSIGTQQKISIIQALLNDPEILILDEPTTNLDPIERNHLLKLLSQLSREKIIIYSTHIVSDIESFTKNVIILKNGEVVQSGTISELIASIPLPIWTTRLFPENYTDAANQLKIINHISNGKEVIIKSISDTPPYATSQRATPTLEDCYLYILNS